MVVVILAAGRGTRLYPYTEDHPKCLTLLNGQTLIERQLATLNAAGLNNVRVVTGYRQEMLDLPGLRRVHNADWATTNMVRSLFAAEAFFGTDLIVTYGDIVYNDAVLRALLSSEHDISVVVDREWKTYWQARSEDPLGDAESLRMDDMGRIIDIGNRINSLNEPEGQYIGLMRFRNQGLVEMCQAYAGMGRIKRPWMDERSLDQAYMTDLLMELIHGKMDVHAVTVSGGWLEIDTTDDLEFASCAITPDGVDRARAMEMEKTKS